MNRLRYRLARLIAGPFVNLPERDGVWIVSHMDGGQTTTIVEADSFRLTMANDLSLRRFGEDFDPTAYGRTSRSGSFEGTVKS